MSRTSPVRPAIPETITAFTLLELLVTTAIIAGLVALSIPALSAARSAANRSKCAANLKSIGTGIQLYINDNNGALPGPCYLPAYAQVGNPPNPLGGNSYILAQLLAPYLGHTFKTYDGSFSSLTLMPEFVCPSLPASIYRSQKTVSYYVTSLASNNTHWFPFGYNGTASSGNRAPLRMAQLAGIAPLSQTVALQEVDAAGPTNSYDYPFSNSLYYVLPKPGHVQRNALYFDWHVAAQ